MHPSIEREILAKEMASLLNRLRVTLGADIPPAVFKVLETVLISGIPFAQPGPHPHPRVPQKKAVIRYKNFLLRRYIVPSGNKRPVE